MKKKLLLFICVICSFRLIAISQVVNSNSRHERNFAFEVKQIDEFFERFNNEKDAFIASYLKANFPGTVVDRESLINNLFNLESDWNKDTLNEFSKHVLDSIHPVFLDFSNKDWYAETQCKFKYNDKVIDVQILLKVQQEANGGTKWMIASAYSKDIPVADDSMTFVHVYDGHKFINPISHATNFIGLSTALMDKSNIRDYLDSNFYVYPASRDFLSALLKNKLECQFVNKITYHFLQVDGWIFTVNYFQRESVNSGWLINTLQRATEEEKEAYRKALFH